MRRSFYLVISTVAAFVLTVPAYTSTFDSQSSSIPVVSRPGIDEKAVLSVSEREIVSGKLQSYGFSAEEVSLLLRTMSREDLRQLANAESLARSGVPRNAVIALLTTLFLVAIGSKLTKVSRKELRSGDSRLSPTGSNRMKTAKWRTDANSAEKISGQTRSRVQRIRRKTRLIPPGKTGDSAAARRKPTPHGR